MCDVESLCMQQMWGKHSKTMWPWLLMFSGSLLATRWRHRVGSVLLLPARLLPHPPALIIPPSRQLQQTVSLRGGCISMCRNYAQSSFQRKFTSIWVCQLLPKNTQVNTYFFTSHKMHLKSEPNNRDFIFWGPLSPQWHSSIHPQPTWKPVKQCNFLMAAELEKQLKLEWLISWVFCVSV